MTRIGVENPAGVKAHGTTVGLFAELRRRYPEARCVADVNETGLDTLHRLRQGRGEMVMEAMELDGRDIRACSAPMQARGLEHGGRKALRRALYASSLRHRVDMHRTGESAAQAEAEKIDSDYVIKKLIETVPEPKSGL